MHEVYAHTPQWAPCQERNERKVLMWLPGIDLTTFARCLLGSVQLLQCSWTWLRRGPPLQSHTATGQAIELCTRRCALQKVSLLPCCTGSD
jgi:hypothetical protein